MSDKYQRLEVNQSQAVGSVICPVGESNCVYLSELQQLRQEVDCLAEQVRTDALTGLFNFRYLNEILPIEMERTRRSGMPMSLILLDIDHFQHFNDQWGHEVGNQAVVHVAQLINLTLRNLDLPCRFGGEEFLLILPNTDITQAVAVAERLRELIASALFKNDGQVIPLTASLGVDEFKLQHPDTPESLLRRVDAWLYLAKDEGRNRVASPELTTGVAAVTPAEKDALFGWENSQ